MMAEIQSCAFVSFSELTKGFDQFGWDDAPFTWGDTDHTLVWKDDLLKALRESDNVPSGLIAKVESLPDVYIDLES